MSAVDDGLDDEVFFVEVEGDDDVRLIADCWSKSLRLHNYRTALLDAMAIVTSNSE